MYTSRALCEEVVVVTGLFWILAGLATIWIAIQLYANRLLYPRSKNFRPGEEGDLREAEDIYFYSQDGISLHGWWFSHPDAKGVLLVCHGNAGNVSDRRWIAEDLQDIPLHLFIFDYRGYGKSDGIPSEKGTGLDVAAAWEVARSKLDAPELDPPIIVYGRSLGGAVALQLAEKYPVRGVILESTFTSILEIGKRFYPWLWPQVTCLNKYRSDQRILKAQAPILIAHSPDDLRVPYDMAETLSQLAPQLDNFYTLQGGHVEAGWQTSPEYAKGIRAFIQKQIVAKDDKRAVQRET